MQTETLMKTSILLVIISFLPSVIFSQELNTRKANLNYREIINYTLLVVNPNIKAFSVDFVDNTNRGIEFTLSNNPQIEELKISRSNQNFINFLSNKPIDSLTHLIINDFRHDSLKIPFIPRLKYLEINSNALRYLDMDSAQMTNLEVLIITTPNLTIWTADKKFPKLELLELKMPEISIFPIEYMPEIYQFSCESTLKEMPKNLCKFRHLTHLSLVNYFPYSISKCLRRKIKRLQYSNVVIIDKNTGQKSFEINSKDHVN